MILDTNPDNIPTIEELEEEQMSLLATALDILCIWASDSFDNDASEF